MLLHMKFSTLLAIVGLSVICLSSVEAATGIYKNFHYTEDASSITIDHVTWQDDYSIDIPTTINGKPVVAIGPRAFVFSTLSKKITIPSTVTSIGAGAFMGMRITEITIPNGVTRIEAETFSYCRSLKTVTIPSSVVEIGDRAFIGCRKLQVSIPPSVVKIGDLAFLSCQALEEVNFSSNLRTIGSSAFSSTGISSLEIPDTILSVGDGAFADCYRISSVRISKSIKHISKGMFRNCGSLASVKIPKGVVSIGDEAFYGTKLTKVQLPSGLKTIGDRSFKYSKLQTVTFPASLVSLGEEAFFNPRKLKGNYLLGALFKGKAPKMGKRVFGKPWNEFIVSMGKDSIGFTQPRWKGYLVSAPAPEIGLIDASGEYIIHKSPEGYRAGQVLIGKKGPELRFTVINSGFKKLENLRAVTAGGNSKDFVVTSVGKSSLKPGEETIVSVRMRPTAKGTRTTTLRILSNDRNEKVFDLKLAGMGLAPFN